MFAATDVGDAQAIGQYALTIATVVASAGIAGLAIVQRIIVAELARRGISRGTGPVVRKLWLTMVGAQIAVGLLWALHLAGVLDPVMVLRYAAPISPMLAGLLLLYLYGPGARQTT